MSWSAIKSSGRGTLEFRVKVAGLDYEFVTNSGMVQDKTDDTGTASGGIVKRRLGLLREGIRVQEQAILPENKVDLTGNSFTIVEDHEYSATRAFYRKPRKFTQLALNTISSTASTIAVTNATGWSNGDYAWIGSECIRIVSDPSETVTGNWVFTIQRGKLGTIAQKHFATTDLGDVVRPAIQDVPYGVENRRAIIYAYGDGDDLQGDGTAIWRGYVTQEAATIDGVSWTFEAGPITEVFKGEIGNSFEEITLRGLYWSKRQWKLEFQRFKGANYRGIVVPGGTLGDLGDITTTIGDASERLEGAIISCTASGFYENKWELAADLNQQLVTASRREWSDSGQEMGCLVIDGELSFTFNTDSDEQLLSGVLGVTTDGIREENRDGPDTGLDLQPWQFLTNFPDRVQTLYNPGTGDTSYRYLNDGRLSKTLQAGNTYAFKLFEPMPEIVAPYYSWVEPISAERDPRRLHVSADSLSSELNDVVVYAKGDDGEGGDTDDAPIGRSVAAEPPVVDLTNRTISAKLYTNFVATNEDVYLVAGTTFERDGHVVNFIEKLVEKSPNLANQGFCPLIGPDDFDLDDMARVISGSSLNLYNSRRRYTFYKKDKKLEEVLQPEFKLIGVYPAINPNGKLTIRPFKQTTQFEVPDHIITHDDILTDESYPTLTPNQYGIWNAVKLKTRFDPLEGEHMGTEFNVNNLDSISQNSGKAKTIEINPLSFPTFPELPIQEFIEPVMWRETGMLAFKYYTTSVEVPLTFFSSAIGDSVRIKSRQLPNRRDTDRNRRGTSVLGGIITARDFNLDEGFGRIEVLLSNEDSLETFDLANPVRDVVYAPEYPIIASTPVTNSAVTVSLDQDVIDEITDPNGGIGDHINIGDRISISPFDSTTEVTGGVATVTDVVGADVVLEFEAADEIPEFTDSCIVWAGLNRTTGALSQSVSASSYAVVDSGVQAPPGGRNQSLPAGNHFYKFTL